MGLIAGLKARLSRRRCGQNTFGFAAAFVGVLLFFTSLMLAAALQVRNERVSDLRAREQGVTQFTRSEAAVSGYAAAEISTPALLGLVGHSGWGDPTASDWSEWRTLDGVPCDLDVVSACWQAKFGATTVRSRRSDVVGHPERTVYLRTISGCVSEASGFSHIVAGIRLARADATDAVLHGSCASVEVSQTEFRERTFLQYGLHIASQALSPRQQSGGNTPIDSSLELDNGTASAADDIPFHTNLREILLCTHGSTAGWPDLGHKVEISDTSLQHGSVVAHSAVFASAGSDCGSLGASPAGITVRASKPLEVAIETPESRADSVARCSLVAPSPPAWMAEASALATRLDTLTPGRDLLVAPGGRFDLSTASSGDVIFSGGGITVAGSPPANSSVSVVSGGRLRIENSMGPSGGSGVLALIAGCDVVIADPLPPFLLTLPLDQATHAVHLERTAVLSPHGSFFAEAFQRPPTSAGQFPLVSVNGAIVSGYLGGFGVHNPSGQAGGYDLSLSYPVDLVDESPPWWPDPLGGPWQQVD